MTERQRDILFRAIREYIRTGEPVGSEHLVSRGVRASPATVRAELAALETDGLISHPHTSAGRVPTPSGYRAYVDDVFARAPGRRPTAQRRAIKQDVEDVRTPEGIRSLAHLLAEMSDVLALVSTTAAFSHDAGYGNLLRLREAADRALLQDVERVVHAFEEHPDMPASAASERLVVLIDGENPFVRTRRVSVVCTCPSLPSGDRLLAALIGPLRMPYERTIGVLEAVHDVFARA